MEGALVLTALRSVSKSISHRTLATKGIFNASVVRTMTVFNMRTNMTSAEKTKVNKRNFITLIRQGEVGVRLYLGKDPVLLQVSLIYQNY